MVFEMIYFEAFSNLPIYPKSDIIFLSQGTSMYYIISKRRGMRGQKLAIFDYIKCCTFIHSRASSRVQRSIFRAARTYFVKTRRYLDSKFAMIKYALQDLMQTLKREITLKQIKAKVQEKKDNGGFHLHLLLPFHL